MIRPLVIILGISLLGFAVWWNSTRSPLQDVRDIQEIQKPSKTQDPEYPLQTKVSSVETKNQKLEKKSSENPPSPEQVGEAEGNDEDYWQTVQEQEAKEKQLDRTELSPLRESDLWQ